MDMNQTQMTLEQWKPEIFHTQNVGVSAHRAKVSQWQELVKDWTDNQDLLEKFFACLEKSNPKIDPNGWSMKMLKECFQAVTDGTMPSFSLRWMTSGTTVNGICSTQRISDVRRIGNVCTLSDILEPEDQIDEKYFLSEKAVSRLISLKDSKVEELIPPTHTHTHTRLENTDSIRQYVSGSRIQPDYTGCLSDGRQGTESQRVSQEVIQIAMCKAERSNPNQYRVYSKYGIAPCLNKAEGGGRTPYIITDEDKECYS